LAKNKVTSQKAIVYGGDPEGSEEAPPALLYSDKDLN